MGEGLCRKGNVISKSMEVEKHKVDLGNGGWLTMVEDESGKGNWFRQRVSEARNLVFSTLAVTAN